MGSLILNSLWLIEADPHRAGPFHYDRLTPQPDGDWHLERMTYDTSAPNGILFSQDERTLYVVQSDYQGVRDLRAYPPAG